MVLKVFCRIFAFLFLFLAVTNSLFSLFIPPSGSTIRIFDFSEEYKEQGNKSISVYIYSSNKEDDKIISSAVNEKIDYHPNSSLLIVSLDRNFITSATKYDIVLELVQINQNGEEIIRCYLCESSISVRTDLRMSDFIYLPQN